MGMTKLQWLLLRHSLDALRDRRVLSHTIHIRLLREIAISAIRPFFRRLPLEYSTECYTEFVFRHGEEPLMSAEYSHSTPPQPRLLRWASGVIHCLQHFPAHTHTKQKMQMQAKFFVRWYLPDNTRKWHSVSLDVHPKVPSASFFR